jgi:hypothetical protein
MKVSDFIYIVDNSLSEEFCQSVIKKFESDCEKHVGRCGDNIINTKTKTSTDIFISNKERWMPEHDVFANSVNDQTLKYDIRNPISEIIPDANVYREEPHSTNLNIFAEGIFNTGFQIQKTKPGEYFNWHYDFGLTQRGPRILTFIWYLNTLEDDDDGYTEFFDGTRVQPKVGRFLMFPACWTFYHRGFPPKKDKYICTGWVHMNWVNMFIPVSP